MTHFIKWKFDDKEEHTDTLPYRVGWDLATDVYNEKENIIVKMHVADIVPDKVDITVDGRELTVSGFRKSEKEIEKKNYYQKEIRTGEFERVIHLPADVKEEEIRATCKEGVLKIILPKKTPPKSKKIKIKVK